MTRRRVFEGFVFAILIFVAMTLFGDPSRTLAALASVNPVPYLLSLVTTLGGIVIWSGTLSVLLRVQGYQPTPGRFQTIFIAGMGVRSLIPGGSTSGPLVVGYVVNRTTEVTSETSIAMAYVLEVFLWIGTAFVGSVGFIGYVLSQNVSPPILQIAIALLTLMVITFGTVLYGIYHPDPIEEWADLIVSTLYSLVEERSTLLRDALDPSAVRKRFDRFFEAFRRLGNDPKHLSPSLVASISGWFVHATTLFFVCQAVDVRGSYFIALVVVPVSGLTEGLSILPGGVGTVGPTILALLMLLTTVPMAVATTIVILYRLSNYWFRVSLGFLSLAVLGIEDVLQSSDFESTNQF